MYNKRPYKFRGKLFFYDDKDALVYYVCKINQEMRDDNAEWMEEYGRPLWDELVDGYCEVNAVGLGIENWKDKSMRDSYLDMWCDEMEEELKYIII